METPEDYEAAWHKLLPEVKAEAAKEAKEARKEDQPVRYEDLVADPEPGTAVARR